MVVAEFVITPDGFVNTSGPTQADRILSNPATEQKRGLRPRTTAHERLGQSSYNGDAASVVALRKPSLCLIICCFRCSPASSLLSA